MEIAFSCVFLGQVQFLFPYKNGQSIPFLLRFLVSRFIAFWTLSLLFQINKHPFHAQSPTKCFLQYIDQEIVNLWRDLFPSENPKFGFQK